MGYMRHHAIIVTGWPEEKMIEANKRAKKIFEKNFDGEPFEKGRSKRLVSDIIKGLSNDEYSFFIAPDGSKEGWQTSDLGDNARKQFLDWMEAEDNYLDYVELSFGGDGDYEKITRSRYTDLNKPQ